MSTLSSSSHPYRDGRILAAEENPVDYTVLAVFVITLGLILVVELFRHRIDVAAQGRPFFKTVLEGVYRELATLGIVEFCVFLLHKYYEKLNIKQEQIFADVHFTLFYTALFNAFQSVLLAIGTSRVSNRLWVRTEQLELDHYVEIREEFDRIHAILYPRQEEEEQQQDDTRRHKPVGSDLRPAKAENSNGTRQDSQHNTNNGETTSNLWADSSLGYRLDWNPCRSIRIFIARTGRFLRYPHLYRKHDDLLIQVRFHELRVHFLRSNELPLKLKVSDYLKRSELHVLTKLVHITTFAWLLLLGGVNLIYYLLGIGVTVTGDPGTAGDALASIFLGVNIMFVVVSIVIYDKMNRVFGRIMHMRLTTKDETATDGVEVKIGTALSVTERELTSQLALFWGDDPSYVTSLIQFMQFGFALGLAILLVFWGEIKGNAAFLDARWLILVVFACYAAFVAIMAHVIPRYTLCTSLGQLVNHRRLHETLARFRLEEAQHKRLEEMEEITLGNSYDWNEGSEDEKAESSPESSDEAGALAAARNVLHATVMGKQRSKKSGTKTTDDIDPRHKSMHFGLMADMVDQDVETLRSTLEEKQPARTANIPAISREERMRERRLMRKKTVSDGVASMLTTGTNQPLADRAQKPSHQLDSSEMVASAGADNQGEMRATRRQRRKTQSASASIQLMRDVTTNQSAGGRGLEPLPEGRPSRDNRSAISNPQLLAELVMTDTKQLRGSLHPPGAPGRSAQTDQEARLASAREARMRERRKRRKSVSDGVALMRRVGSMSDAASEVLETIPDHVPESQVALPDALASYRERRKSNSDSSRMKRMRGHASHTECDDVQEEKAGVASIAAFGSRVSTRERRKSHSDSTRMKRMSDPMIILGDDIPPGKAVTAAALPVSSEAHVSLPETVANGAVSFKPELSEFSGRSSLDRYESNVSDDGHSDADDIPEMNPTFKQRQCAEPEPRPSISNIVREYFLTRKYQMISAIFGTMICFFTVSERVEVFLLETCILPDNDNTFDARLNVLFWSETCLLSCFIVGSFMSIVLFAPEQHDNFRHRTRLVAGILDVLLSGLCLAILMIAENQRCCDTNDRRFLAATDAKDASCSEPEDCCSSFGSRSYGGLGNLEPFTSLIALRVLRFYGSKKLLQFLSPRVGMSTPSPMDAQTERLHDHPIHPTFDRAENAHQTSMEDEKGTVIELWKHALGLYPDIVEHYGEFSGELLQVMLGVEIMERKEKQTSETNVPEPSPEGASSPPVNSDSKGRRASFRVDERYSTLAPDVQSIILSGKLGRSVKSSRNVTSGGEQNGTTVAYAQTGLQPLKEASPVARFIDQAVPAFEFGIEEPMVNSGDPLSSLVAPNSRLVRSMRRCDRRLPPLLDEWTVVDVVMTKHEIVYFDVSDIDNFFHSDRTSEEISKIESVYHALSATRGGKGLRLRDVAVGRKIVGHQALSSIESIVVERIVPFDPNVIGDDHDDPENLEEANDEFWKPSYVASRAPRTCRWQKLKEDRLKLQSHHETLYLRFYSDLEDSEAHRDRCLDEREEDGPIFKNNALQWCQTVVRLCGADQLKQKFPHYGDDNSDELRDYIQVLGAEDADKTQGMMKKLKIKLHHRRASSSNLQALALFTEAGTPATPGTVGKTHLYRRSSSVGESDSGTATARKPSFFHRSSSTGNLDSGLHEGSDMV